MATTKTREEWNAYKKKHYAENKELYLARNRRKRNRLRDYIHKAKDVPCTDCKVRYPYYVMDFDHKSNKVYAMHDIARRHSLALVKSEIAKCDVVCSNCHRGRTHLRACGDKDETSRKQPND